MKRRLKLNDMKNIKNIEKIVAETTTEYGDLMGVEMKVWNEKRIYFSRPDAPNAYKNVGYVDIATKAIFPQNTPKSAFKVRTERDKSYINFLQRVADEI